MALAMLEVAAQIRYEVTREISSSAVGALNDEGEGFNVLFVYLVCLLFYFIFYYYYACLFVLFGLVYLMSLSSTLFYSLTGSLGCCFICLFVVMSQGFCWFCFVLLSPC